MKMTKAVFILKKPIVVALVLAGLLSAAFQTQAQCNWGISTVPQASACAASGKITVSLTGTDVGSLSNILYSLEPVTPGGYAISPNGSSILENIPPGQYKVRVQATCNGTVMSNYSDVQIQGNYIAFTAAISQKRPALNACNTGQATVTVTAGRSPYNIKIQSAPAGYTGPVTFTVRTSPFLLDNLNKGDYTISIADSCGSTESTQYLTIAELPPLVSSQFYPHELSVIDEVCNRFYVSAPYILANSSLSGYDGSETPLMYTVAFDGGAKLPYKQMNYISPGNNDTIILPAGKTLKDAYGKILTYYVKPPCGPEVVINRTLYTPFPYFSSTPNCDIDFDARYTLNGNALFACFPLYTVFKNNSTGIYHRDTIKTKTDNIYDRVVKKLPYGGYSVTCTTADGYVLYENNNWVVNKPASNPYAVSIGPYMGGSGNDGAVMFTINKSTGNFVEGTEIQLVGPSNYNFYTKTSSLNVRNSFFALATTTDTPARFFYPGTYLFRVTDNCGSYELPVTVAEKEAYRYNWSISQRETCTGLKLTGAGSCTYNNTNYPIYMKIITGPSGFNNGVVPIDSSLILPSPGTYKIAVSSEPNNFYASFTFTTINNGVAEKYITYDYKPLGVDVNSSWGWVCPGGADNDGSINVQAINGRVSTSGAYTYKLAAAGNGIAGPYLATNTTGKFSTAMSGGAYALMKNQNYDIRVEDGCGAGVVQTIKVLDVGATQIASSDKSQYCEGDIIRLSAFNMPSANVQYQWTGPNGFSSTAQNPTVPASLPNAGLYQVVITGFCSASITGQVNVRVAPTVITCYSAVTDTSVNPYVYGLLGNWRKVKSYVNYGNRTGNSNDIRQDGFFANYTPYWKSSAKGLQLGDNLPAGGWVWTGEVTLYNKKGYELESRDPLDRYNAGLYGYGNTLPVAVVQNSRYREAAFEGFEDYDFENNACGASCSTPRSFDFSSYKSQLDSTEKHSGKYSLRVDAGKAAGMTVAVTASDNNSYGFTSNTVLDNCGGSSGSQYLLRSVRATSDALLPAFSPLSGKNILFSVWAKEAQNCNCTGYSNNQMGIVITQPSGTTTVIAKPVGAIIDGWQRYEQVVYLPADVTKLSFTLEAKGASVVYFDDLRIHPYNANMKSFVYNPVSLRLMAELDENNYATFYEYDDDGALIRLKKETQRGVQTIRETRNALLKE
ncbi:hypothetical protein FHW36_10420 [Chitinophaga polysaccharea]|uniref:SprB-like repeat protein n=1 Tax=Chitinophaga polysaccharea TaxID=1293035 RepID=A0A561PQF6_9BACT|nr:hypothetical protein [Chitinophaga polysaccharea]TWF40338.1 hypothetical protein FHW36_10420 [Chitinophaga polysaccharea]